MVNSISFGSKVILPVNNGVSVIDCCSEKDIDLVNKEIKRLENDGKDDKVSIYVVDPNYYVEMPSLAMRVYRKENGVMKMGESDSSVILEDLPKRYEEACKDLKPLKKETIINDYLA